MLLQSENRTHVTTFPAQSKTFTIAASAHAFKILSNNLYENPTKACVREIIANALDANTRANSKQPISVRLPTALLAEFSVRDYGPSMSHDFVMSLYTTYFASDKNHSNDEIGGFGLGSKSPYAVSDQFTVRCIQNGQLRTYQCFLNSNGLPQIQPIALYTPTDEPDGTQITVPVPDRAISGVVEAYKEVVAYLDVQPRNNIGYVAEPPDHLFKLTRDGWSFELRRSLNDTVVVLGVFPYRLPYNHGLHDFFRNARSGAVIRAPIGALTVTPSRESLSLTTQDIVALNDFAEHVISKIQSQLQTQLNKLKTALDVARFTARIKRSFSGISLDTLTWKGYNLGTDALILQLPHRPRLPQLPTDHLDGPPRFFQKIRRGNTTRIELGQNHSLDFDHDIKIINLPTFSARWKHLTENDIQHTQYIVFSTPNAASLTRWAALFGAPVIPYQAATRAPRTASGGPSPAALRSPFKYVGLTLRGDKLQLTLAEILQRMEQYPLIDNAYGFDKVTLKQPDAFHINIPEAHTKVAKHLKATPCADIIDELVDWEDTAERMARYHTPARDEMLPHHAVNKTYWDLPARFADCPDLIELIRLDEAARRLWQGHYIDVPDAYAARIKPMVEKYRTAIDAELDALKVQLDVLKTKYPDLWNYKLRYNDLIPVGMLRAYLGAPK
jgi:hypothetical protein